MLSDFQSQGYGLLVINLVESFQDLSFWSGYWKIMYNLVQWSKKDRHILIRIFAKEHLDYCGTDNLKILLNLHTLNAQPSIQIFNGLYCSVI